ncbi:winged helix-turn-helix transcriptional regulator [Clostridiaceae bacterium HSG29]|nr:winged helix-turn-helix transcriptional regulator [Clostridiaceae bacterium HSG29]
MTKREIEIYNLIKNNPFISQKEIAEKVGIKRSSVGVHVANLIKKGRIKGKCYVLNQNDYAVIIGGSNMDLTGFSNEFIILNDSNPGKLKISMGGVGRNIAENLVKLNINAKLLSVVGSDIYGDKIINESRKIGIDMDNIYISHNNPTSTYLSVMDKDGDMKLAISDMDISSEISIEYLEKYKELILRAKALVIDTNMDEHVIDYIFDAFSDKKIFVDTVSTVKAVKIKKHLNKIYTLKPNKIEAEKLLDIEINNEIDMQNAVEKFLKLGVQQVIISNGSKNIHFGNCEGVFNMKTERIDIVNSTGAGDAFIAGLVYSYMKDIELDKAIKLSMKMSRFALESEKTISDLISEKIILESIKEI